VQHLHHCLSEGFAWCGGRGQVAQGADGVSEVHIAVIRVGELWKVKRDEKEKEEEKEVEQRRVQSEIVLGQRCRKQHRRQLGLECLKSAVR
jgi:hypothetical protein